MDGKSLLLKTDDLAILDLEAVEELDGLVGGFLTTTDHTTERSAHSGVTIVLGELHTTDNETGENFAVLLTIKPVVAAIGLEVILRCWKIEVEKIVSKMYTKDVAEAKYVKVGTYPRTCSCPWGACHRA